MDVWVDGCHKGAATTNGTTYKIREVKEEGGGHHGRTDGRTAAERKERHLVQGTRAVRDYYVVVITTETARLAHGGTWQSASAGQISTQAASPRVSPAKKVRSVHKRGYFLFGSILVRQAGDGLNQRHLIILALIRV